MKASVNKKKYTKVEVDIQAKKYQYKFEKEINDDIEKHGKKPLSNEELIVKKIDSKTDKDSGMFLRMTFPY